MAARGLVNRRRSESSESLLSLPNDEEEKETLTGGARRVAVGGIAL